MDKRTPHHRLMAAAVLIVVAYSAMAGVASAQTESPDNHVIFGLKIRAGGRYDDVRMCVATAAGVKGGIAADISFFAEVEVAENISLHVDLPVFRPILFALAFEMLQFEPSVTLKFRKVTDGKVDLIAGPTLGVSLHYGPDYLSEQSGAGRGASFFALGPMIGGYFGLDFKRPDKVFNFELGLTPYVTPLFGVDDSREHRGVVVGGLLDGAFKFNSN